MKTLPIAIVFLPPADIPTFVGEGRVSLGLTGRVQIAEYDARVRAATRKRMESGNSSANESGREVGVEEVLALDFGKCDL